MRLKAEGKSVILESLGWYARVDSNHRPFAPEAKDPPRVFIGLHAVCGLYVDRNQPFQPTSHHPAAFFIRITFVLATSKSAAFTSFSARCSSTSQACSLGVCV